MNNLSSYWGLIDAKIRTSDKDLHVLRTYLQVKEGSDLRSEKILLFEFYLLPLLTFLHTSRFVRYDLEYAILIHKCLTLYANNYMQAQKWLQCTLTLTTLMYNFAMTGFFTWFDSTPPCGQNCIFLRGSAYWRVSVPPPRPLKFVFSKKATKFDKILTVNLTLTCTVKSTVKILSIFVAFLENANFTNITYSSD